jgi:hypothetical protein
MFIIDTAAKAKKSARAMEKSLAKQGIELGHGHALNVVAALAGFTDWNAMLGHFEPATPAVASPSVAFVPTILDVEFESVERARVYNAEYEIIEAEGYHRYKPWLPKWASLDNPYYGMNPKILLLMTLNDEVCGDETMTVKELLAFKWDASKKYFVNSSGDIFQLLSTGPDVFDARLGTGTVKTAAATADSPFSILDVDFSQVTGLSRDRRGYWVDASEYPTALEWLKDWSNPANPHLPEAPVLDLSYLDDDGFTQYEQIWADELLALTWNAQKGVFVCPEGIDYKFAVQVLVGPNSPGLRKS